MKPDNHLPLPRPDMAAELLAQGIDPRAIERGKRIAEDTGQPLGTVLVQLGLATEREIANAFAALLGTVVANPSRYPQAGPLPFADLLAARFLRAARALPVAIEDGVLVVVVTDPLDAFTSAAIAAATGQAVRIEIAVPIELEAALARLLTEPDAQAVEGMDPETGSEDDAESSVPYT